MKNIKAIKVKKESPNPFLKEYDTDYAVRKYVKKTAGEGIEYLLTNVYGPIYLENIKALQEDNHLAPIKMLEFGCGAGMNLIYLLNNIRNEGIPVSAAYGTDFSLKMVNAANNEARKYLSLEDLAKSKFIVASNENIQHELSRQCGLAPNYFNNFFDFILGVNTFRYCWRSNKAQQCAQLLYNMLSRGGRVIIIDMNNKFPYYLAELKSLLSKRKNGSYENKQNKIDYFRTIWQRNNNLPTLEEYVQPFRKVGFEIIKKDIFNWVSHSSGKLRLIVTRSLSPLLDLLFPDRAMRILLIARKPLIPGK